MITVIIVEEDLAEALNRGKISGAALDVVSTEPYGHCSRESRKIFRRNSCKCGKQIIGKKS
ncbi:NAD(P)-dependent oxidoreductase [Clostridium ragsdalei]|nr:MULTISPECIES: NAD(P)-dependent oxidoreductase [Clostridium]